jgi:hypothetical protein
MLLPQRGEPQMKAKKVVKPSKTSASAASSSVKKKKVLKEVKRGPGRPPGSKNKVHKHAEGLVAMSDGTTIWIDGRVAGYKYRKRDNLSIINNRQGLGWIALQSEDGKTNVSITGFNKDGSARETHVFRLSPDNAAKRVNRILKKEGWGPVS